MTPLTFSKWRGGTKFRRSPQHRKAAAYNSQPTFGAYLRSFGDSARLDPIKGLRFAKPMTEIDHES
jgi:hypothetical protein